MNGSRPGGLTFLYLLNLALLFTHEMDAAYWHAWELFGITGGIQSFLVLNLILGLVALWGLKVVAGGGRTGLGFSLALALAGVFAGAVYTYFILTGHPQFQAPASRALLGGILVLSAIQAITTVRAMRAGEGRAGSRGAIKIASTSAGRADDAE